MRPPARLRGSEASARCGESFGTDTQSCSQAAASTMSNRAPSAAARRRAFATTRRTWSRSWAASPPAFASSPRQRGSSSTSRSGMAAAKVPRRTGSTGGATWPQGASAEEGLHAPTQSAGFSAFHLLKRQPGSAPRAEPQPAASIIVVFASAGRLGDLLAQHAEHALDANLGRTEESRPLFKQGYAFVQLRCYLFALRGGENSSGSIHENRVSRVPQTYRGFYRAERWVITY